MIASLADYTTLRLGGTAEVVEVIDEPSLVEAVRESDREGTPVLILGGGSNVVVADQGFDGRVIVVRTQGTYVESDACSGAMVRVAAGETWDAFVECAVVEGWIGVEALAGIPGSSGATPIQNVGAYGQEVSQTVASVRCWDRVEAVTRTFSVSECDFSYRMSRFKAKPGRYVVLEVVFQCRLGHLSAPIGYAELAQALGVAVGDRAPMNEVRQAVLSLRGTKGMVLDPSDHDTWSAGSFFTNPIVRPDLIPEGAPAWPQPDGYVKTSAAWLIEHAGFGKGYGNATVSLSTKHTLALTNRGSARTTDLLALAAEVRGGVKRRFGIVLEPEPVMVGCGLEDP